MTPVVTGRKANPHTTHDCAGIAAWNFKLKAEIHSYEDCEEFAEEHRGEAVSGFLWQEYGLGPKMLLRWRGDHDAWAIVLYDTEIVRYYPDGTFSVDNGGFNTLTTTERLRTVLPPGFNCYHFSTAEIKGKLGLTYKGSPYAQRRKTQTPGTLWPLDHGVRVSRDGEIIEQVSGVTTREETT